MAEIVNLRQIRKRKARSEKEREADRNRTLHGLPKSERERGRRLADKAERFLEGHRRGAPGDADGGPDE